VSTFVGDGLLMSAYVSIRQHTSAYVSIRQHTPIDLQCRHLLEMLADELVPRTHSLPLLLLYQRLIQPPALAAVLKSLSY
jgi:hypothetical protein